MTTTTATVPTHLPLGRLATRLGLAPVVLLRWVQERRLVGRPVAGSSWGAHEYPVAVAERLAAERLRDKLAAAQG